MQSTTIDSSFSTSMIWRREPTNTWRFEIGNDSFNTHYVRFDPSTSTTPYKPIVLVHGFGACYYHWRYNVDALVDAGYTVFCPDLLGFGLSDKPRYAYATSLWALQIAHFCRQVVRAPAVLAGNSLGGYVSLATAAEHPDAVCGLCLFNAAGSFKQAESTTKSSKQDSPFSTALQKVLFFFSFAFLRQRKRIDGILRSVYPVDASMIDDKLIDSILYPATLADSEVYRMVVTRPGGPGRPMDDLLADCHVPILLAWGLLDPWIRPAVADRLVAIHASLDRPPPLARVDLQAGHWCAALCRLLLVITLSSLVCPVRTTNPRPLPTPPFSRGSERQA